jgi:Domain of unknown function (DUF4373)
MARPIKTGLDYFPMDCNIDDNLQLIEAEHGLPGFAIVVKLWQKIYSSGYYIKWDEDEALLFSRKINTEITLVSSVITSCFKRKIFDESLHKKYKILTSSGIQKRFLLACSQIKRSSISVITEFILVSSEFTRFITEETSVNSVFSTQKKGEEIKGEETKGSIAAKAAELEKKKSDFLHSLTPFSQKHNGIYPPEMLKNFFDYWTEKNPSGTLMRFQQQKTWETNLRLATWARKETIIQNGKHHSANGNAKIDYTKVNHDPNDKF